jgi:hypothetical protein
MDYFVSNDVSDYVTDIRTEDANHIDIVQHISILDLNPKTSSTDKVIILEIVAVVLVILSIWWTQA